MAYEPSIPTEKHDPEYFQRELQNIKTAIDKVEQLLMREFNTAPTKPRNGLFLFADGVNFNPGDGRGLYLYDGDNAHYFKISMQQVAIANPITGSITFSKELPTVTGA